VLKSLGPTGKQELLAICSQIYETWVWPNDFMESVIIPVEKKSGAQECVDFRTISLVSHASKIVLKILTCRLESKAEIFLEKDQYVFRKGRGTRDAIAALRVMYERSLDHQNKIYVCYVDFEKAFGHVIWYKLMSLLQSMGVDLMDRKLIWNLYNGHKAYVRIGEEQSGACSVVTLVVHNI